MIDHIYIRYERVFMVFPAIPSATSNWALGDFGYFGQTFARQTPPNGPGKDILGKS